MMILVDSTVWIDFFRGRVSAQADYLTKALEEEEDICICGPVLTEVLQGIIDETQFQKAKEFFGRLIFLPLTERSFVLSAEIYRQARLNGRVVRKTIDCIIASCAIAHNIPLLHNDEDFNVLQKHSKLHCLKI